MFYRGKMLYKIVSFTYSGKKKESKEISLQGFVEESNLRKLFIGAAHYVNLASPDIQKLPLRAFTVKERRKQKSEGLSQTVMIKAAVIITDHHKE